MYLQKKRSAFEYGGGCNYIKGAGSVKFERSVVLGCVLVSKSRLPLFWSIDKADSDIARAKVHSKTWKTANDVLKIMIEN